jgi:phosphohistidine phosphatase
MKHLYLARHAKSVWPDSGLSDYDRPLTHRGKSESKMMGTTLKSEWGIALDNVLCSPARRARATARRLTKGLGYERDQIVMEEIIYSGTEQDLLNLISRQENTCQSVMVVGHNPTITDLVQILISEQVPEMDTCSVYGLTLDISAWGAVSDSCARKLFFESPKHPHGGA